MQMFKKSQTNNYGWPTVTPLWPSVTVCDPQWPSMTVCDLTLCDLEDGVGDAGEGPVVGQLRHPEHVHAPPLRVLHDLEHAQRENF